MEALYHNKEWLENKYHKEKLTKEQISKLCGVNRNTIYRWIKIFNIFSRPFSETNGGRSPSDKTRNKMSKALKGKPSWSKGLTKEIDIRLKQRGEKQKGKNSIHWKGGRYKYNKGYIMVWIDETSPFYEMVQKGTRRIQEHRLVMAQHLKRCLKSSEYVHHINWIKDDNRIKNLVLVTQKQHSEMRDYFAKLWVKEHPDIVGKVTKDFLQTTIVSCGDTIIL